MDRVHRQGYRGDIATLQGISVSVGYRATPVTLYAVFMFCASAT